MVKCGCRLRSAHFHFAIEALTHWLSNMDKSDHFAKKPIKISGPQQSTNLGVRSSNLFGRASSLEDQTQRSALFVAIIVRKRRMAPQIHAVVQDASDFDDASLTDAVHQEVTPAAAMPGNVQGAQARHYLVPGLGPGNVRTIRKFADRLDQRVAIDSGLPRAEVFSRPFEDICEIKLGCGTQADTPFPLSHEAYSAVPEMTLSAMSFK